ncbi:MAG TPA: hypothetical protein VMW81_07390 [Nitrospinota bacterium]|nr:hypothetical protein [Nitrospinota bacterium]
MKKEIEPKQFEDETSNIITSTLRNLLEGITGILTSERKDYILSVSRIFQRMRGGQFLSIFKEEWDKFKEKGRIKDDYQFTEQHKVCLQELLDFLDNDSPDEMHFSVLKKIFLVAASEKVTDRNSILPQQYMKICRNLSSGEILVLNACYQVTKEDWFKNTKQIDSGAGYWLKKIAEKSNLKYNELVEVHENELIKKKLLTDRQYGDRSGVMPKPYYRITKLGYEICKYIESYEEEK